MEQNKVNWTSLAYPILPTFIHMDRQKNESTSLLHVNFMHFAKEWINTKYLNVCFITTLCIDLCTLCLTSPSPISVSTPYLMVKMH
jgi:hypothetical protein